MKLKLKPTWILLLIGVVALYFIFGRQREGFIDAPTCPDGAKANSSGKCSDNSTVTCPNSLNLIDLPPHGLKCVSPFTMYDPIEDTCSQTLLEGKIISTGRKTCIPDLISRASEQRRSAEPGSTPEPSSNSSPSSGATGTSSSSSSASSSSSSQPTPSGYSQRVWGPPFVGTGQAGDGDGDSTKTTTYPQLLGGNATPYKGGDGSKIQFPSLGSLGLNADANFFPFSRSPGDMDLIADPYRVSQSFSAASYSSTPAPAPFLTDFSAFQ